MTSPRDLRELAIAALRADGTRCRPGVDGALAVAARSQGRELPLLVRCYPTGLELAVTLGVLPAAGRLRSLMRFHAHALAGAVTAHAAAGELELRTFTPLPAPVRSRELVGEALTLMAQRLISTEAVYRDGELDGVLELTALPATETVGGQTPEGGEVAERVELALQELLMPVGTSVPGRRLFTAGPGRAAVGVEVVGVLLRVVAAVGAAPADTQIPGLLARAHGNAVFGLEARPGVGEHLVACAATKLPERLRTVSALRGVLAGMVADVDTLAASKAPVAGALACRAVSAAAACPARQARASRELELKARRRRRR